MSKSEPSESAFPSVGDGRDADGDYDLLPYLSLPASYSQPARLGALGDLFGLDSPTVPEARVLELGCASGGNIIPLAARFPRARFSGIDMSARQIDDGRRRVEMLGLTNIDLQHADIADFDPPAASFEYVICHGVFSWVPAEVQDAIFRVVSSCLVDNGIAAISYNVLPGWHLRSPVRDVLRHYAGTEGSPQERVARARAALQLTAGSIAGRYAYGSVLRAEAAHLRLLPSSYFLGEFLAEHNTPMTFHDFVAAARRHDLDFLCEADLNSGTRELVTPEARRRIAGVAVTDRIEAEQQLDHISGRPFRRSLIIKGRRARSVSAPTPDRLRQLQMTARLVPDLARSTGDLTYFTDGRGGPVGTKVAAVARALAQLGKEYPGTVSIESLATGPDGAPVTKALLKLLFEGRADIAKVPLRVGRSSDERPRAWVQARAEAAMGLPWGTSMRHLVVELPKGAAAITARLDGKTSKEELVEWLAGEIAAGTVELPVGDITAAEPTVVSARRHVDKILRHLADGAVLLPT